MVLKYGKFRVGMNPKASPMHIIFDIFGLFIALFIGDKVIDITRDLISGGSNLDIQNDKAFYEVYKFFGIQAQTGSSAGLLAIIGILLGIVVLTKAIRVSKI